MNRYKDNLKRLLNLDETIGGIPAAEIKPAINGRRGIAFYDAKGNSKIATSRPPSVNGATSEFEAGGIPIGGGGAGTGTAYTHGSTGSNAGNTLAGADKDAPDTQPPPPTEIDTAEYDIGNLGIGLRPQTIGGLFNCTTGAEYKIRMDGASVLADPPPPAENTDTISGYVQHTFTGYINNTQTNHSNFLAFFPQINNPVAVVRCTGANNIFWTAGDIYEGVSVNYPDHMQFNVGQQSCSADFGASLCTINGGAWPCSSDFWSGGYAFEVLIIDADATSGDDHRTFQVNPNAGATSFNDGTIPLPAYNELLYDKETGLFTAAPENTDTDTTTFAEPVSTFYLCDSSDVKHQFYPQANGGYALKNFATNRATFFDETGKVIGFGDEAAITAGLPQ